MLMFQQFLNLLRSYGNNPFADYYIFLVLRFLIYIYLFVKLSDIMLGYERPNLEARVLKKFNYIYGDQILKELNKSDIQELQLTINNTILNATKQLTVNPKYTNPSLDDSINDNFKFSFESEARSLKNYDMAETITRASFKKNKKLKFDQAKNQYFDPPSVQQSEQAKNIFQFPLQSQKDKQQVEIQPKSSKKQQTLNSQKQKQAPCGKLPADKADKQQQIVQRNIHYPQQELIISKMPSDQSNNQKKEQSQLLLDQNFSDQQKQNKLQEPQNKFGNFTLESRFNLLTTE